MPVYDGLDHEFTSRSTGSDIRIHPGKNETLLIEGLSINSKIIYVNEVKDFPTEIAGVITLENDVLYHITTNIDLLGSRILCGNKTILQGNSADTCSIKSTGLGAGIPLISSTNSFTCRNLNFNSVDTCFSMLASVPNTFNLVMESTSITGVSNIGLFKNYNLFSFFRCLISSSANLIIDETMTIVQFDTTTFLNFANQTVIKVLSTCTISVKLKVTECNFGISGTGVGIDVHVGASIPGSSYYMSNCFFKFGSSTFLTGIDFNDSRSIFFKNYGITNSRTIGSYFLSSGASTPLVINVFSKILGTTSPSSLNSKFSHTDNKLTYTGDITETFLVFYSVGLFGTDFDIINTSVFKNGSQLAGSLAIVSVINTFNLVISASWSVELKTNDYIEIYAKNTSGSNAITVNQLTVNITPVGI